MAAFGFTLFDTAIGRCGVAWGPKGIVALRLPEASPAATRVSLLRAAPGGAEAAPPPAIRAAIGDIVMLLDGAPRDLSHVLIDMERIPHFHRRVYEAARAIPPRTVLTYGDLAARLGEPGAARAVGQALGQNPFAIIVPCHRVVAAGGRLGGFSANGGAATKRRILDIEGAIHSAPMLPGIL